MPCATPVWLLAASGLLLAPPATTAWAGNAPGHETPAPYLGMCPATLPAQVDPAVWHAERLERGQNTPLREVQWNADQERGNVGNVQCHYEAGDVHYWSHPVLTGVFKTRQPDSSAWPVWHRMYDGSDHWLCDSKPGTAIDTRDCPFDIIPETRARKLLDPRNSTLPF